MTRPWIIWLSGVAHGALLTIFLALFFLILTSCTHVVPASPPQVPTPGVTTHYWHTHDLADDGAMCRPYWIRPVPYCRRTGYVLTYNGCSWACRLWMSEAGQ